MDNKIIDFHVHIFPEKIAEKAVNSIGDYYNLNMSGKGTICDLLIRGEKIGIRKYIIHSTATKAEQVKAVNDFIIESKNENDKFIGFGTLHPDFDDIEEEFERLISSGLKGIKLHPDFQNFSINDPSMMKIYSIAEGRLPILIHMGDENKDSSAPQRLSIILEKFPRLIFIAAHLGGYRMWNDSLKLLAGKNIYFDTSSSLPFLEPDDVVTIIKKHGTDKVLFGTDYPMWEPHEELERFYRLKLNDKIKEDILYNNAVNLLGI